MLDTIVKLNTDSPGRHLRKLLLLLPATLLFGGLPVQAAVTNDISPNVLNEIRALFEEKASWTPAQAKMDSQLIHAAKRSRGEAFAAGAPNLRFDVALRTDGRVMVDI